MDSFRRFPPLTDIFTFGQRPQLQGSVKSLCVRYLERFMSTINGRHVLSADHSINWHLISGWTWRTASLAWYNHWGRNQAQVWAFKPNGAEWKKALPIVHSNITMITAWEFHYSMKYSTCMNMAMSNWALSKECGVKKCSAVNCWEHILFAPRRQLPAGPCQCSLSNQQSIFFSFSNIRQIFGPTVSVSGTAPSVQDLCLPSAVPTHLFPFDIHPSTSHNRFIVIFTIFSPYVWVSSPQIYERVNIVESFPDPHRSLRFRNGTFDLREIPAQGKILNKFEVDSD